MDNWLSSWFNGINYWHWFGFAGILLVIELLAGVTGGYLFWIGIASVITGIFTLLLPHLYWPYQMLIFAVGDVVVVFIWWRYLSSHPSKSQDPNLNRRSNQYVGRIFTLTEPVVNGRGKVKVDDSSWRIDCVIDLPVGSKVRIIGTDGIILKAEKTE